MKIGILGGSFNPAHKGHLAISKEAKKRFKLKKIIWAVFFSILVAGSTSAIAWLLDPAIKKIFIDKDETLIFLIPTFIIITFAAKGISLYFAKSIMIHVGEEIKKLLQFNRKKIFK